MAKKKKKTKKKLYYKNCVFDYKTSIAGKEPSIEEMLRISAAHLLPPEDPNLDDYDRQRLAELGPNFYKTISNDGKSHYRCSDLILTGPDGEEMTLSANSIQEMLSKQQN